MQDEYQSLVQNATWTELVPLKGIHVLQGKWVYALKKDEHGQITRYKAQWVAKGFEQEYGVNYEQTFASVAKLMAIRILFALAAHEDMEIDQMDAVTAFLQSNMQDVVWVEMPTGFKKGDHACLLKKGLYGLKQSARL